LKTGKNFSKTLTGRFKRKTVRKSLFFVDKTFKNIIMPHKGGSFLPEDLRDKLELPEDWSYFFLGGSSLLAIDPLVACLKTTHPEWKVRDIKTGRAVTGDWIDEFIQKNNGWDKTKRMLLRQNIVVLLQKADREIEPLKSIKK
jgi:hypothetical protein